MTKYAAEDFQLKATKDDGAQPTNTTDRQRDSHYSSPVAGKK